MSQPVSHNEAERELKVTIAGSWREYVDLIGCKIKLKKIASYETL